MMSLTNSTATATYSADAEHRERLLGLFDNPPKPRFNLCYAHEYEAKKAAGEIPDGDRAIQLTHGGQ